MAMNRFRLAAAVLIVSLSAPVEGVGAAEGMWPPALLPDAQPEKILGTRIDGKLLEQLRLATVKFAGATGFFLSPDGLMLSNHHVGVRCIQAVSTTNNNYYVNGFIARNRSEELRCPGDEVRVLVSYSEITDEIARAATRQPANRAQAEAQAQAAIEDRCARETGLVCEGVSFSGGARRFVYRYRKYDDVRLVASPEVQVAYFGGDPDNFEYPRYGIDVALFRVYEGGKPVVPPAYLNVAGRGVAEGDAVIVSGHPFRTNRGLTVPQLEVLRDLALPLWVGAHERRIKLLEAYRTGPAERAHSTTIYFNARNSYKRDSGFLAALRQPETLAAQKANFDRLAAALPGDEARRDLARLLDRAAQFAESERKFAVESYYVTHFTGSRLFEWAALLTRWAEQIAIPESERLDDFRGARLKATENWIVSQTPVYPDLERVVLADRWLEAAEKLGASNPYVRALAGVDAAALIGTTALADPATRKGLLTAGPKAVLESTDPLLVLARRLEPQLRRGRLRLEKEFREPAEQLQQDLARLRVLAYGNTVAPDANGSLRFAFGRAAGYREGALEQPWATRLGGMYERAERVGYQPPNNLPRIWRERRDAVDMQAPANFVSTLDHSGGNSGSPIVNVRGEWVGILHDGNRQYLGTQYVYSAEQARTIATHADAIMAWLGAVHQAHGLVAEMKGR